MKLSDTVKALVEETSNSRDLDLNQLETPAQFKQVSQSLGVDYRVRAESNQFIASVFDGIDFDSKQLRSQAFFILDREQPVAIISFVVAPVAWIEQQRYLKQLSDSVKVCQADEAFGVKEVPQFFIIPAWTRVADEYRTRFAFSGFRFIRSLIGILEGFAPQATWIELVAQGRYDLGNEPKIIELKVGQELPFNQCPFLVEDLGQHKEQSSATVKMAPFLGLNRIPDICQIKTLGPVFVRRVG